MYSFISVSARLATLLGNYGLVCVIGAHRRFALGALKGPKQLALLSNKHLIKP